MPPLVSIIVPVYGVETYIQDCAKSILNQTYDNLEIIFVNDCTKDNSMKFLQKCIEKHSKDIHKIKIINHKENEGVAAARRTGLRSATGDYVIQFDGDDFVEPDIIESLVKNAVKEDADIVICDFDYVFEDHASPIYVNPPLSSIELICKLFTGEIHSSLWNKLIKRDLYQIHNINFTVGLNMCEDFSVMYRLLYYAKRITYVPKVLYHYRQNVANSFSSQKMPLRFQQNQIQLLEQINDFLNTNNEHRNGQLRKFFRYLVLGKKGTMLLYGDINYLDFFKRNELQFSIVDIISHPNLHRNFKIILLLDKLGMMSSIKLIKNIAQII